MTVCAAGGLPIVGEAREVAHPQTGLRVVMCAAHAQTIECGGELAFLFNDAPAVVDHLAGIFKTPCPERLAELEAAEVVDDYDEDRQLLDRIWAGTGGLPEVDD